MRFDNKIRSSPVLVAVSGAQLQSALPEEGADIVAVARTEEALREAVAAIESRGHRALPIGADVVSR